MAITVTAPLWIGIFIGAIIGAVVVLEMFLHQIFGESTTYSWMVGYLWLPTYNYSKLVFSTIGWEPFSDIGTLLGAFIASIFVSRRFQAFNRWVPKTWKKRFGDSEIKRALGVFGGSFMVLFGARMADGCASGHILSGDLQMAVSSIEFFVFVTISLLVAGWFIYSRKAGGIKMEEEKRERKSEKGIKSFAGLMSLLVVVVAALTVRGYNGYDPNPNSVAITGFVMIVALLLTAVWYRTKYPGYSNDGTED